MVQRRQWLLQCHSGLWGWYTGETDKIILASSSLQLQLVGLDPNLLWFALKNGSKSKSFIWFNYFDKYLSETFK